MAGTWSDRVRGIVAAAAGRQEGRAASAGGGSEARIPAMAESAKPLVFTEIEVRSFLPSGWGIQPGSTGRWDPERGSWSIEIYDGADNTWKVGVEAGEAAAQGRLEALKAKIDALYRKALGRKSVLTG